MDGACMDGAVHLGNNSGLFPPPFKRYSKGTAIGTSARTPFGLSTLREEAWREETKDMPPLVQLTPISLDEIR